MSNVSRSGGLSSLTVKIKDLDGYSLRAGWAGNRYAPGTPVAGVAAVQEFGSPARGIPPRPFLRNAIRGDKSQWMKTVQKGASAVLRGNAQTEDVMTALGIQSVDSIQSAIADISSPPLSPLTLALRRYKDDFGLDSVSGAIVGKVAAAIARGETGVGQLGEPAQNTDPLQDTKTMINSVGFEITEVR